MAVAQTKYVYYRIKRAKQITDIHKSPEFQSSFAIEKLVLLEDHKQTEETMLQLIMSSVASVIKG